MFSADMIVPSRADTLNALIDQIGLIHPPAEASKYFETGGWDVTFAPVHSHRGHAPTTIEILEPFDIPAERVGQPGWRNAGRMTLQSQPQRKWLTHATVVVTSELDAVVERARRSGRRHWFQSPPEMPGFPRLWMGIVGADHADYDPTADCGLMLEFIPRGASTFSVQEIDPSPDIPRPGEAGIRRVAFRDFLVRDLDAALRDLQETFAWEPAHEIREEPERGYRFAPMSTNHPQGASLRLIQAIDPSSQTGKDFAGEGHGPYTIVCSVYDLDATAADLTARNTPFIRLPAGKHEPETISVLSANLGAPFALIAG
jgi:hypothetical protein